MANVAKVTALCAGTFVFFLVIGRMIGHGEKVLVTANDGLNGLKEIGSKLDEATSGIKNSLSSMEAKEKTQLMDDRSRLSVRNASKYLLHKYGIWDFKSFSGEGDNNNNNNISSEKEQKLILALYFNIRSFSDIVKKEEEKAAKEVKKEEPKESAVTEIKKEEPKEEAADLEKILGEILASLKENRIQLSCEIKLADFKRLIELNASAKKPDMPECVIQ